MKPETLMVSRMTSTKAEAVRVQSKLAKLGGKELKIVGVRGGPWRVRGRMELGNFARFCANEARDGYGLQYKTVKVLSKHPIWCGCELRKDHFVSLEQACCTEHKERN